jgi:hypothetical protein
MSLPTPGTNRLQVLRAVEDGWQAFCRAPWTFLFFQVLVLTVMSPFLWLIHRALLHLVLGDAPLFHPIATQIALVVGVVGYVVLALWALVGFSRGAWQSLSGQKPSFRTFSRWDGAASGRLFASGVLLLLVLSVVGGVAWGIGLGLEKIRAGLFLVPLLAFAIFKIWLVISQQFLLPMALFGVKKPLDTLQSGIAGVNPSWWTVLWFAVLEAVVALVAWFFKEGGLLVLAPVLICMGTAGYRQLFGSQDHTGILSNN